MDKKILFLIIGNGKLKENTRISIEANCGKEDTKIFIKYNDVITENYYTLKNEVNKIINDVSNFDYVCLVPNGSEMNTDSKKILLEHIKVTSQEYTGIYFPLVLYNNEVVTVLNKSIWNSAIASMPGILDIDLALKQIDSTIFGAFIPTNMFFDEKNYKTDLKYYQQYYFVNRISDNDENVILGIPKILLTIKNEWDFKMDNISQEDKLKYYNLSREEWSKENQKITEDK